MHILFGKAEVEFDQAKYAKVRGKREAKKMAAALEKARTQLDGDQFDITLKVGALGPHDFMISDDVWIDANYNIKEGPNAGKSGFVNDRLKTANNWIVSAVGLPVVGAVGLFNKEWRQMFRSGVRRLKSEKVGPFVEKFVKSLKADMQAEK